MQYYGAVLAAKMYGLTCPKPPAPDKLVDEGDVISVGNLQLEVLFTPGHSPGHVCFHDKANK